MQRNSTLVHLVFSSGSVFRLVWFALILGVAILLLSASTWAAQRGVGQQPGGSSQALVHDVLRLRILAGDMAFHASRAGRYEPEAMDGLVSPVSEFNRLWNRVRPVLARQLEEETGPDADGVQRQLAEVDRLWRQAEQNLNTLHDKADSVARIETAEQTFDASIPRLQVAYDEVLEVLLAEGAPSATAVVVQRQSWLAERIWRSLNVIAHGPDRPNRAMDRFEHDLAFLVLVHNGLMAGESELGLAPLSPAARSGLRKIDTLINRLHATGEGVVDAHGDLVAVDNNAQGATRALRTVSSTLNDLQILLSETMTAVGTSEQ